MGVLGSERAQKLFGTISTPAKNYTLSVVFFLDVWNVLTVKLRDHLINMKTAFPIEKQHTHPTSPDA